MGACNSSGTARAINERCNRTRRQRRRSSSSSSPSLSISGAVVAPERADNTNNIDTPTDKNKNNNERASARSGATFELVAGESGSQNAQCVRTNGSTNKDSSDLAAALAPEVRAIASAAETERTPELNSKEKPEPETSKSKLDKLAGKSSWQLITSDTIAARLFFVFLLARDS